VPEPDTYDIEEWFTSCCLIISDWMTNGTEFCV